MSAGAPRPAPHVLRTQHPAIVRVNRLAAVAAAKGREVISLGQATSNVPPPVAPGALRELMDARSLAHYSPDAGLPELHAAVAEDLRVRRGAAIDPDRELVITAGANHAFHSALHAILTPGEEVVLPTPLYFNHQMAVELLGGVRRQAPCDSGFLPTPEHLERALCDRTRAIVLVSPSNPTGRVMPREVVTRVLGLAADRGVWVVFDETYEGIVYTGEAADYSAASLLREYPNLIVISSFSKRLGMAGCRVGTLLADGELVEQVLKIQDTTVICAATLSQRIAARCLPGLGDHLRGIVATMRPRRELLLKRLTAFTDTDFIAPDGAFFFFIDITPTGLGSWEFVEAAIRDYGVVTVPGACCGDGWDRRVRLAFGAVTADRLDEAIGRLEEMWRQRL